MCAANAIGKGKASSSPCAPASLKGFSFSGAMTLAVKSIIGLMKYREQSFQIREMVS